MAPHLVALGLSASLPFKKLSLDAWQAILDAVSARMDVRWVVLGGPEDAALAAQLCQGRDAIDLCGQLGFAETFVALRGTVGALAVDSFVKHAAALLGVPVVELSCQSRLGDPAAEYGGLRFGAWDVPTRVLKPARPAPGCPVDACVQGHPHCTAGIEAAAVAEACVALFAAQP